METVYGDPYPNLQGPRVLGVHTETRKEEDTLHEVGQRQGEPEPRPMGVRESEGRIRAMTVGNGWRPDPPEQRRPVSV